MNIHTNTGSAASPALDLKKMEPNAEPLAEADQQEVLNFLSRRPVNTVILAGWIHDHGIVSPQHRGAFYGYRDENGDLAGVALIGKNLLFEASSDEAITAFAKAARECPDVRMLFAEEEKLIKFWPHFRSETPMPMVSHHRLISSGGLMEEDLENVSELRIATRDELDQIVSTHAEMVLTETGIDPLLADVDGFRQRCATRVDRNRIWVWMDGRELIFKSDIMSVTPEAIYMEGLWVNPKHRGKRYSTRCMATLSRQLGSGSQVVSAFVDADHVLFGSLYRKAGFVEIDEYAKIYL